MAVKYCPVCGKELENDAVKCKLCGYDFSAASLKADEQINTAVNSVNPAAFYAPPAGAPINQSPFEPAQPVQQYLPSFAPPFVMYGAAQPAPVYALPLKEQKQGKGSGIASLVLGIIAVIMTVSLLFAGIYFFESYNNRTVSDEITDYGYGYETSDYDRYISDKTDAISKTAIVVIFSVLAFSLGLVGRKNGTGVAGTVLGGLSFALAVFSIVLVLATSVMII